MWEWLSCLRQSGTTPSGMQKGGCLYGISVPFSFFLYLNLISFSVYLRYIPPYHLKIYLHLVDDAVILQVILIALFTVLWRKSLWHSFRAGSQHASCDHCKRSSDKFWNKCVPRNLHQIFVETWFLCPSLPFLFAFIEFDNLIYFRMLDFILSHSNNKHVRSSWLCVC